jgi:hypothetical protein
MCSPIVLGFAPPSMKKALARIQADSNLCKSASHFFSEE